MYLTLPAEFLVKSCTTMTSNSPQVYRKQKINVHVSAHDILGRFYLVSIINSSTSKQVRVSSVGSKLIFATRFCEKSYYFFSPYTRTHRVELARSGYR